MVCECIGFYEPPAMLITVNCGTGQVSQILPYIVYADKTFAFGGIVLDSCGKVLLGTGGGNHTEFKEMLAESSYGPVMRANTIGSGAYLFAFDFINLSYADFLGGYSTPLIDLTNTATAGFRIVHPFCATGFQPVLETSSSTVSYNGIELNNTTQGCNYTGTNYYVQREGHYSVDMYSNTSIRLDGATGKVFYRMPAPAAPQSAVVSAGGNVPLGAHVYTASAMDFDTGETTMSVGSVSATATSGNQTITVTLPASFPPGATGINLYRDGNKVSQAPCNGAPQFTTPGGTYVDTFSFTCGNSPTLITTAGTATISANGVTSTAFRIGSESLTASPRGEQNIFFPGALTSTWTGSSWTIDKGVTVTRVQVQAKTAPTGCTTNAVLRVTDGTTPINVTISGAANDSGALSQNYAAGAVLTMSVQTAAAGCTTAPADANLTVQYRMQ